MSDRPLQRWCFVLGRTARDCQVFLNEEQWFNVRSVKIEAGVDQVTVLTLELYPTEVAVEILDSQVQLRPDTASPGDVDDGFFGERGA